MNTSGDSAATIRVLTDRFVKAFNAGNIDAIMSNYIGDESGARYQRLSQNSRQLADRA